MPSLAAVVEQALDVERERAGDEDAREVDERAARPSRCAVSQSPKASAMPMLAAAGIVVTLISTPISAPDLAVLRLSIPAAPAQTATMKANASGWRCCSPADGDSTSKASGIRSAPSKASVASDGGGDREREAERERGRRPPREVLAQLHERDAQAGDRTELRADDHRADDQDLAVEEDPDRRDDPGQDHVEQEDGRTARRSRWCAGRAPPRSRRPRASRARA